MINTTRTSSKSDTFSKEGIKTNFIVLMVLLLFGVLIGTLAFCFMNKDEINNLSFITQLFIRNKAEMTFVQSLANSFTSSGIILLVCFLLGFSAITQPVEIIIPVFKGLGLGASIAYIYIIYGIKGFLIALLMIIPNAVISSICLIVATRESIKMSNNFTLYALSVNRQEELKPNLKLYIFKFLILLIVICLSSVIDSLLAFIFAGILL